MPINWPAIYDIYSARAAKPPTFSDEQIAAACAAANALPGKKKDATKLDVPWLAPKKMPDISEVDFRDITTRSVPIAGLMSSTKSIDRARLVWHIQNPGQTRNPSVFTGNPLVLDHKQGQVIVDGHHRLYAMQLLGQTKWPVYLLPSK